MQLIGIYLCPDTPAKIKKNLKGGWYPFLEGFDYVDGTIKESRTEQTCLDNLYTKNESGPQISVHAIVGMNGCGKSTLLEILYRIINNLAFQTLGNEKREGSARLMSTKGLYATLYYKQELDIKQLECSNYSITIDDKVPTKQDLESVFYTIAINYSQYSLNSLEIYEKGKPIKKDGIYVRDEYGTILVKHWLNGLYHKNDGYQTPIVISPMRSLGNIDINTEISLSKQRIIGLAILGELKQKQFLEEYKPVTLIYKLDIEKISAKIAYLDSVWIKSGNKRFLEKLRVIMCTWASKLNFEEKLKSILDDSKSQTTFKTNLPFAKDVVIKTIFQYLAIKTISISSKYNKFRNICYIAPKSGYTDESLHELIGELHLEKSHITLKLHQTIKYFEFIKDNNEYFSQKNKLDTPIKEDVSSFISSKFGNTTAYNSLTIDDVLGKMYPSIFDIDIEFEMVDKQKTNLSLMSSGERQLLYSMSAVLYHLGNIHSVKGTSNNPKFKHVNIILDEVEMYYHPEYQRIFLSKILGLIDALNLSKKEIESINICLITHSPFILSDILRQNTLYLENGIPVNNQIEGETFGANYYDLLRNGFFLKQNSMGLFASNEIKSILEASKSTSIKNKKDLIDKIGDPFIRNYLLNKL